MKRELIIALTLLLVLPMVGIVSYGGAGPSGRAYIENISSTKIADGADVNIEVRGTASSTYTLNTDAGFLALYNTSELKYIYNTTNTVPGSYWVNVTAHDLMGTVWDNFTLNVNHPPVISDVGLTGPDPPLGNLTHHTVEAYYHDLDVEVPSGVTAYVDPRSWSDSTGTYSGYLYSMEMSVSGGGSYGDPASPVRYESPQFLLPPGTHDIVVVTDDSWDTVRSSPERVFASIEPAVAPLTGQLVDMYDSGPVGGTISFERVDTHTLITLHSSPVNGNFSEPNFPVGAYTVKAQANGYYPSTPLAYEHDASGGHLALQLEAIVPFTLTGYVNGPGGTPLGAEITVTNASSSLKLTTSSGGMFHSELMVGSYSVSVVSQGYVPATANITVTKDAGPGHVEWLNFSMAYDMVDVWGYVLDSGSSEKILGALVEFSNVTAVPVAYTGISLSSNDPDMRYSLHLPAGRYSITVTAAGYLDMEGLVDLDGDIRLNLTVDPIPTAELELGFLLGDERYDRGVDILLSYQDLSGSISTFNGTVFSSHRIDGMAVHDAILTVFSDGWYYKEMQLTVPILEGENSLLVNLQPMPLANLSGVVTVDGVAAKVVLTLIYDDDSQAESFSGGSGAYEFNDIRPGHCRVEVSMPVPIVSQSLNTITLVAGDNTLDLAILTLEPTPSYSILVGPILDSSGVPVEGISVVLSSDICATRTLTTDSTGMVMFNDVSEGGYKITIYGGPGRMDHTSTIYVTNGSVTFSTDLRLQDIPIYTLTVGPILDRDSKAKEGMHVVLSFKENDTLVEEKITDAWGMVVFHVPAGSYVVKVKGTERYNEISQDVNVVGDTSGVLEDRKLSYNSAYSARQDLSSWVENIGLPICLAIIVISLVVVVVVIALIVALIMSVVRGISNMVQRRRKKKRDHELERMKRAREEKAYRKGKAKEEWESAAKLKKDDGQESVGHVEKKRTRAKKKEEGKTYLAGGSRGEADTVATSDDDHTHAFISEHATPEYIPVSQRIAEKEASGEEELVEVPPQPALEDKPVEGSALYDPGFDTLNRQA